jgi:hypothetical protein
MVIFRTYLDTPGHFLYIFGNNFRTFLIYRDYCTVNDLLQNQDFMHVNTMITTTRLDDTLIEKFASRNVLQKFPS